MTSNFAIMVFSGVTVASTRGRPDLSKENKVEDTDGVRVMGEEILLSNAAPAHSIGAASENGGSTHFVQVRDFGFF